MNILFIQSHNTTFKKSMRGEGFCVFPWGIATVVRCLEDDGHAVSIIDAWAENLTVFEVMERARKIIYDVVCISGFTSSTYSTVVHLAEKLKEYSQVPIVVGGLLANAHYELLLAKKTVDVCVIGEGEITTVELFRHFNMLETVKGIAYRVKDTIVRNESRLLIRDLDSLPMPHFDTWNMEVYTKGRTFVHDAKTRYEEYPISKKYPLSMLTPNIALFSGRGCPYRCAYCSRSYDTVRFKSTDRIIYEIRYLKEAYNIKMFHFVDELLVVNKKRIKDFCEMIKRENVLWDCQARVNTVDYNIMKMMRDANCISIGFGVESGSNRMLTAMKKETTRKQSIRALKDATKVGLHLKLQFMTGYPGETEETLRDTARIFKEVNIPPRRMSWCTPLPGSELYRNACAAGLIHNEEAFLEKLQYGWNRPGRILLNVSGQSDEEMVRLFYWGHLEMEKYYIWGKMQKIVVLFDPLFWYIVYQFIVEYEKYCAQYKPNAWIYRNIIRLASIRDFFIPSWKKNIEQKRYLWKKLPRVIASCRNQGISSVYFYGAGAHTKMLLREWRKRQRPRVKGIFVSEKNKVAKISGVQVYVFGERALKKNEGIILSSRLYEQEMVKRCAKEVSLDVVFPIYMTKDAIRETLDTMTVS